jgi:zinc protease
MPTRSAFFALLTFALAACSAPAPVVVTEAPAPPEVDDTIPADQLAGPLPAPVGTVLETDSDVRTGALANGLVYYILENQEPRGRAELRLAVDAGSALETERQRGLAHFLEHMAFNGTARFPEGELVDYLEQTGTRFGPDLNAYTSFDETVYLLQVPTDSADLFATGLDVLSEWAGAIAFAPEEIEKERGVVLEEWRLGRGASERIFQQQLPALLGGTRYENRLPIGEPEVLRTAPREQFTRFYSDWYRPDLMAVVVVGDVDVDETEAMIRERFAGLANPPDAPERPRFAYQLPEAPRVAVATDAELTYTSVNVYYPRESVPTRTEEDAREDLVRSLFASMLSERLSERTQQADPPYIGAGAFDGGFVRPAAFFGLGAQVPEGEVEEGLSALLTEAARVRQHGFTEGEVGRAKADLLRSAQRAAAEAETTPSRSLAGGLVSQFLENEAFVSAEAKYALAQRLLPTITADELSAQADRLMPAERSVLLVAAPENETAPPTEADLLALFEDVATADTEPYEDADLAAPLVADVPAPQIPRSTSDYPTLGVREITYPNGVRLVVKETDFKADEVLLRAFSPGGTAALTDEEYDDARFSTALVGESGVGAYGQVELGKKLAGQAVGVSPYIGELEEGFSGSASPDDLETLFQLVYLYATEPRRDAVAVESFRQRVAAALEGREASPDAAFADTVTATLTRYDPRAEPLTPADLVALNADRAFDLYDQRFADFDDFTFVVVGSAETEEVEALASRYLAALPALDRVDVPDSARVDVRPPDGVVTKTVRRGIEPKARVQMVYHGELAPNTLERRVAFQTMEGVLSIRLREALREEQGGVYGVGVSGGADRTTGAYTLTIRFGCDPERVDKLIAEAKRVVGEVRREPAPEDLAKVQEQRRRGQELNLRENSYWAGILTNAYRYDESPDVYLDEVPALIASLDADEIRALAAETLREEQVAQFVLLPQE